MSEREALLVQHWIRLHSLVFLDTMDYKGFVISVTDLKYGLSQKQIVSASFSDYPIIKPNMSISYRDQKAKEHNATLLDV